MHKEIKYVVDENGCHICVSHYVDEDGYPRIMWKNKPVRMHRYIYTIHYGEIPKGVVVRHKCDNRMCINPEHLELGIHADNVRDRVKRGRSAIGMRNGRAKLNEEAVTFIRTSNEPIGQLARRFGVDRKLIRNIKAGLLWKHVV